jgi:tRNA pseudouridine55 synthase
MYQSVHAFKAVCLSAPLHPTEHFLKVYKHLLFEFLLGGHYVRLFTPCCDGVYPLMMSGSPCATINLYKPKGPTSHDIVAHMRRVFGLKKVGHLGTLDPMAEGVLPLCMGSATRLIEYFPDTKTYEAGIRLGKETRTLDLEGDVWKEVPVPEGLNEALLEQVFEQFRGDIEQKVPRYSAVHFNGKKLYHYARQGIRIPFEDLPVKPVTISELTLIDAHLDQPEPEFRIRVSSSSGTYIRSLVRDIAYALGTVGIMTSLIRTRHGRFLHTESHTLEAITNAPDPWALTVNPLQFLSLPMVTLADDVAYTRLMQGAVLDETQFSPAISHNDTLAMAIYGRKCAGVVAWDNDRLRPRKMMDVEFTQDINTLLRC